MNLHRAKKPVEIGILCNPTIESKVDPYDSHLFGRVEFVFHHHFVIPSTSTLLSSILKFPKVPQSTFNYLKCPEVPHKVS